EKLIPMKAGVIELLEYLQEQGIRIGLASSTRKDIVERELADAGILHYFESVTGGDVVKISKPNPEIYLIACDKMQESPEECFAIEDSFNGIRAAKAAGMRPIMVPDLIQPTDEIRQMAETVCSDLFGVIDYLRNLQ
ncbi:MAG: HAD family hydrolase, partial [Lachnospiraceae bacterium]|nr:HAD family hydrolase [Lachnospiraceae bacterium]